MIAEIRKVRNRSGWPTQDHLLAAHLLPHDDCKVLSHLRVDVTLPVRVIQGSITDFAGLHQIVVVAFSVYIAAHLLCELDDELRQVGFSVRVLHISCMNWVRILMRIG